jgi:His-Xaa-Ser system protein HxsD
VVEVTLDFSTETQSLAALNAAIYRLIGTGTATVEKASGRWVCLLKASPTRAGRKPIDAEAMRVRFLDLVADENLREQIAVKTEPMRDVIVALAFGSLAKSDTQ